MSTAILDLPNVTLRLSDDDRKALWLAERRTCITGTDVAAIFGHNPYKSPVDVWLSKKTELSTEVNDAMVFGSRFERPILEVYSERMKQPLEFADPWKVIHVPGFPLLGASLDARWLTGDRRPVDAKTAGFKSAQWGENGSDEFPIAYMFQLALQMMATETHAADLAVCFGGYGGHKFSRYTVQADPEVEESIKERAADWWQKHVVADIPPEPDGSAAYGDYLKARFRKSTEVIAVATPEAQEWAAALREATERMKAAETAKEQAQQRLKAYMGDASAIPGICTWRSNRDSEITDWRAIVSELATLIDGEKVAQIIECNTSQKPGPRVFRVSK